MNQYQELNKSYINGVWVDGQESTQQNMVNPYNNDVLAKVNIASFDQLNEAFEGAKEAQSSWGQDADLRKKVMTNALSYFKENKEALMEMLTLESGSTQVKANLELDLTIGLMEESIKMVDEIGKFEEKPSIIPNKVNENYRLPKGVISSIAPFNFPLYLSMRTIAPALALGNTVVHKADIQCGLISGSAIAKAYEEAGIPSGVFQSILTTPEIIGDGMFNHKDANLVSFTGSTPVGRQIGKVAGEQLKEVALELGGNGPFCVLQDADIDQAVNAAIFGKHLHQGQICMAINRIIVHEDVYDAFAEKFVAKAKELKYGDPRDPDVVVGPLINEKQVERAEDIINKAKEAGFDMLLEGERVGNILTPTVIGNVDNDSEVAQSELFSPVALITKASSDSEVIEKANATQYGLSSSIFSNDEEKAREYALKLAFGMTHINDQPVNDEPTALFGGMRQSGIGRFGSPYVIDEFTEGKWISVQKEFRDYPF
ncbi:aldehyde dehydrogenase family protein [Virgibacillus halodenitrificans]|uniref:aldehyde dehydrogenase family protein n=1 Tax=Virgibacillus halodenitrificans TaxID=1482 RepID=UPI002DBF868A|nr:aldehyde dehydrogenase family protein [Virgibacillus halodenitrificans]MEC2160775.1 aldehyde dehydrogenase family protein [Virgibacillus halodenitrificans]